MRWRVLPLAALFLFSATAHAADAPVTPGALPHFMSLKTEGANGRRGPSSDQPVLWIYQRVGLPFQVTGQSGNWRRLKDPDGVTVWMQARYLEDRRSVMVRGHEDTPMRFEADPKSHAKAYLAPGVVGYVTGCSGAFRRVVVGARSGWVAADALWGADPSCTPENE